MFDSFFNFIKGLFKRSKEKEALYWLGLKHIPTYLEYKNYYRNYIIRNRTSRHKREILAANTFILSHHSLYDKSYLEQADLNELNRIDRVVKVRDELFDRAITALRKKHLQIDLPKIVVKKRRRSNLLLFDGEFARRQLDFLRKKVSKSTIRREKKEKPKKLEKRAVAPEKKEVKKIKREELKQGDTLCIECYICKEFTGSRSELVKHMRNTH